MAADHTVLVVDDAEDNRVLISAIIDRVDGFAVVGEAQDMATAQALWREHRPDVAILDVSLPDGSGLDLVPQIRKDLPGVVVILATNYESADLGDLHGVDYVAHKAHLLDLGEMLRRLVTR